MVILVQEGATIFLTAVGVCTSGKRPIIYQAMKMYAAQGHLCRTCISSPIGFVWTRHAAFSISTTVEHHTVPIIVRLDRVDFCSFLLFLLPWRHLRPVDYHYTSCLG